MPKGLCPSRGQGGGLPRLRAGLCARRLTPLPLLPPDLAGQAGLQKLQPAFPEVKIELNGKGPVRGLNPLRPALGADPGALL